ASSAAASTHTTGRCTESKQSGCLSCILLQILRQNSLGSPLSAPVWTRPPSWAALAGGRSSGRESPHPSEDWASGITRESCPAPLKRSSSSQEGNSPVTGSDPV